MRAIIPPFQGLDAAAGLGVGSAVLCLNGTAVGWVSAVETIVGLTLVSDPVGYKVGNTFVVPVGGAGNYRLDLMFVLRLGIATIITGATARMRVQVNALNIREVWSDIRGNSTGMAVAGTPAVTLALSFVIALADADSVRFTVTQTNNEVVSLTPSTTAGQTYFQMTRVT